MMPSDPEYQNFYSVLRDKFALRFEDPLEPQVVYFSRVEDALSCALDLSRDSRRGFTITVFSTAKDFVCHIRDGNFIRLS
jgi:hypothetical protein